MDSWVWFILSSGGSVVEIDKLTHPDVEGKAADEAIKILADHCLEPRRVILRMNQEIEDLKKEVGNQSADPPYP